MERAAAWFPILDRIPIVAGCASGDEVLAISDLLASDPTPIMEYLGESADVKKYVDAFKEVWWLTEAHCAHRIRVLAGHASEFRTAFDCHHVVMDHWCAIMEFAGEDALADDQVIQARVTESDLWAALTEDCVYCMYVFG